LTALRNCLDSLGERERQMLELRFGLNGERPQTLEEVGILFNVSRERVRQIEAQSLKKLAALAEAQDLREVA
jgi:RNA polymerase primary sigma factor